MDAIKIGVPGVLNLSQLKSGSNDPHIRWTLIGLEDQLWGKSVPLSGQMGMICCFQVYVHRCSSSNLSNQNLSLECHFLK